MTYEKIQIAKEDGLATLTLNAPDRLNAVSRKMIGELKQCWEELAADRSVRAVLLTGAGRGFCAGADLADPDRAKGNTSDPGEALDKFFNPVIRLMRSVPKPIVAAVNGPAFGGGMALACASDIRIAGESARFCSASIRTGLSGCEMGMTFTLPRLIGNARAFDLILTGRDIDAAEAAELGIVSRVVPDDELLETALSYGRRMAAYTGDGLRTTKRVLWQNVQTPNLDAALALEINAQMRLNQSAEVQAYMAAYRQATTGG